MRYASQNTVYLIFVPLLDRIVVSVKVMFIPNSTDEYFAELELLKIDVA